MISLDVIALVLTGLSITVSIIYYAGVLRNSDKARMREMIYQRFQLANQDYIKTFFEVSTYTDWSTIKEFEKKYGRWHNPEAAIKMTYVLSVYNTVGVQWKEENIDLDFLLKLYPPQVVIRLWENFKQVIEDIRIRTGNPEHLIHLEMLYDEVKKRHPNITSWYVDEHGIEAIEKNT